MLYTICYIALDNTSVLPAKAEAADRSLEEVQFLLRTVVQCHLGLSLLPNTYPALHNSGCV